MNAYQTEFVILCGCVSLAFFWMWIVSPLFVDVKVSLRTLATTVFVAATFYAVSAVLRGLFFAIEAFYNFLGTL